MVLAFAHSMTIFRATIQIRHLGPAPEPLKITKRAKFVPDERIKLFPRPPQAVLHGDHLATQFLRRYE